MSGMPVSPLSSNIRKGEGLTNLSALQNSKASLLHVAYVATLHHEMGRYGHYSRVLSTGSELANH